MLVRTAASLISAGTERALTELGQKSLLGKARERPELIGKVWEKVKSEGIAQALEGVRDKLDQSHAVGYSAAGIVLECAKDVTDFRVGDRVACAVVAEGRPAPITLQELEATTRATFRIRDSLRTGQKIKVMSNE